MTIEDEINGQLEWGLEDSGIGGYEFWGSKEYDKSQEVVLETNEAVIAFDPDDHDECIPVAVSLSTTVWVHDDLSADVGWQALLAHIEFKNKKWEATYDITQENY